jgi:hypothetical protein
MAYVTYPNYPAIREEPVLAWPENSVAHVRFNRPKACKAIKGSMEQALSTACTPISLGRRVRVVHIGVQQLSILGSFVELLGMGLWIS